MGDKPGKGSVRGIAMRALAIVLVVALLSTTLLLYRKTEVTFDVRNIENRGARVAAEQLVSGSTYANAPRLRRMATYAQNFLSGDRTFADCNMAAQIAIANADFAGAAAYTERAIELYDGEELGLAAMEMRQGFLYTLLGDYKSALKWLNKGLAIAELPEARLTRAQVRLNLGDPQGALKDVETYVAEAEDPTEMLPNLVNVYEAAGEYETAIDCYTQLIQHRDVPDDLLNRAYCYTSLDRMAEAKADCEAYAKAGGAETDQAEVMLGTGWMRSGDYAEAGACFERAMDGGYPDPEALYYYVVLCAYVTEDFSRAADYGDRMIERIRSGTKAGSADVRMENSTGRLNVKLVPMDEASLCMMTGASHMRLEGYDRAVDCLTMCLDRDPENSFAHYLRASCLLASERYREAIADFEAAMAAGEDEERCRYGRAVCLSQLGDSEGALKDFDWVMLNGSDEQLFAESAKLMTRLLNGEGEAEAAQN